MTKEIEASRNWRYETAFYISMTSSDVQEVAGCLSLMRDLEENMTKSEKDTCTKRVLAVLGNERKARELQEEKYNYSEIKGERVK
jgi:hypothetical protein